MALKKTTVGLIIIGLALVLTVFLYCSKQGPAIPVISHVNEGVITGKHFMGATMVYISAVPSTGISALINSHFKIKDDNTIVMDDGQPDIPPSDGDDFNLYVVNSAGVVSMPFETQLSSQSTENVSTSSDDIALFGTATSTIRGMADFFSGILLENDRVVPKYVDFLNDDLQTTCPFYKPSGVAYRDCLANLLANKEQAAERIYTDVVADMQIINNEAMAQDPVDGHMTVETNKGFLASLATFHAREKPYRDALCDTELSMMDGSNAGGFIDTCELYEITDYETRLLDFRYQWIDTTIQNYMDHGTEIKTNAFKQLVQREQNMFGQ